MQRMFGLWNFNVEILTLLLLLLDGICKETPGRMVQSYYGVGHEPLLLDGPVQNFF